MIIHGMDSSSILDNNRISEEDCTVLFNYPDRQDLPECVVIAIPLSLEEAEATMEPSPSREENGQAIPVATVDPDPSGTTDQEEEDSKHPPSTPTKKPPSMPTAPPKSEIKCQRIQVKSEKIEDAMELFAGAQDYNLKVLGQEESTKRTQALELTKRTAAAEATNQAVTNQSKEKTKQSELEVKKKTELDVKKMELEIEKLRIKQSLQNPQRALIPVPSSQILQPASIPIPPSQSTSTSTSTPTPSLVSRPAEAADSTLTSTQTQQPPQPPPVWTSVLTVPGKSSFPQAPRMAKFLAPAKCGGKFI